MTLSALGRWSTDDIRTAADIAREKGVPMVPGADGSILNGRHQPRAEHLSEIESTPPEMTAVFSPATRAKRWHCAEKHIRNLMQSDQLAYGRGSCSGSHVGHVVVPAEVSSETVRVVVRKQRHHMDVRQVVKPA